MSQMQLKGMFWLGLAGVSLILGGIISILAANWVHVPFVAQVCLALAPLAISLVGVWCYQRKGEPRDDVEEVLGTAWAGSVLCAVALLARVLQLSSDAFAFCATMVVLLAAVTWRLRSVMASLVQLGFLFALFERDVPSFLGFPDEVCSFTVLLLGGALTAPRLWANCRLTGVRGVFAKAVAVIALYSYASALVARTIDFLDVSRYFPGILLTLFSGFAAVWFWLEQRVTSWKRPLSLFGIVVVGSFVLFSGSDYLIMWPFGVVVLIGLACMWRWVVRSNAVLLCLVPLVCLCREWEVWGDGLIVLGISAIMVVGLVRGSRLVANTALVFLLIFCSSIIVQYDAKLMLLGLLFVVSGLLLSVLNRYFARLSGWVNQRYPALCETVYLRPFPLPSAVFQASVKRLLLRLAVVILVAQVVVPGWMLVKRHLILTRGEVVELDVSVLDPRDLFAGRYVRLWCNEIPDALKGVPQHYLRYYCDERYAADFERAVIAASEKALLRVRLWRGNALAEELLIGDLPAYDYVQQQKEPKKTLMDFGKVRMGYAIEACAEVGVVAPATNFDHTQRNTYAPLLLGMDEIWRTYLASLQIDATHRVPHLLWMDKWLANEDLPAEAFPVMTPKQYERHLEALRDLHVRHWLLPAFTGWPKTLPACDLSFEERAARYYQVIKEKVPTWRFNEEFFSVHPPRDETEATAIWNAMDTACKTSQWFIVVKDQSLPEGFPWTLPAKRIWVISQTPPDQTVNWIKWFPDVKTFERETEEALAAIPNCKGWMVNATFAEWEPVQGDEAELRATIAQTAKSLNADCSPLQQLSELELHLTALYQLLQLQQRETTPQLTADLQQLETWLTYIQKAILFTTAEDTEAYQQWHLRHNGQKATELPSLHWQHTIPPATLNTLKHRYNL